MHAFKAHLTASILTSLALQLLKRMATADSREVGGLTVDSKTFEGPVYIYIKPFYIMPVEAVCWENGPQNIRH